MLSIRSGRVMNKRRTFIVIMCAVLWAVIIGRLFYLQIISYDSYKAAVADNIQRQTTISATRGTIYDRNMVQLATNTTTYRIFIAPNCIENDEEAQLISRFLSETLEVEYSTIYNKSKMTHRADETVKKNVDSDTADTVRKFINENEYGRKIYLEASTKRYYPYGTLASSVIGLSGTDSGLSGIELSYDEYLKGTDGRYITAKNGSGGSMPFKYDTYVDAINGYNAVSTLDITIQAILEEQLRAAYENGDPLNRACGVIMNPNNGEIYAMATYPTFDLNDPYTLNADSQAAFDALGLAPDSEEYTEKRTEYVYEMWKNKAVTDLYEPGSTFKVVTTAMALEENAVTFDDEFTCTGALRIEGWTQPIHCHKKGGHGTHPYWHQLQQSCNPTLMQVAERIGGQNFYSYFEAFGFTSKTGIDLPGEAVGQYQSYSSFNNVSLAVYSFGQTFTTTALQQITAISTVANGGYLVKPHVVSALVDDNGNVVADFTDSVKYQVVSSDICDDISTVLEEGVSGDGGARNARVSGYKIAAKTGTSEKRDKLNEEGETQYVVCSTVAYAPADDPQVAVLIMVDEPQGENLFGSYIAAPFVANVMEEILPYLGVERSTVETSVTVADFVQSEVSRAKSDVDVLGLEAVVVGEGATVVAQIPAAGSRVEEGGTVVLYTGTAAPEDTVVVPDLSEMSAAQASNALAELGLNIYISGAEGTGAYVYAQSIEANTMVPVGTVVTVDLMYMTGLTD